MIQAAPRGTSACGPGTKHSLRAFEGMHEELQRQIQKIAEECAAPGWDGYGASPVTPEAVSQARRFAEAIPTELPTPTIGVEPDGAFTFEWYRNPRIRAADWLDVRVARRSRGAARFRSRRRDAGRPRTHGVTLLRRFAPRAS